MHKLLLADDSVTIQRVIELTFSGEDIQVVAVNDGEQAIARIPVEQPDIVLADIGMPKKGGYDVAAFVKGRGDLEHIPVLLLAGAFEPVDQARAEQVRCDGVLIKPFEPRQVIERVRELLEGVKGTPAQATADVPRPVERLSPRPEPPTPIAAAAPTLETPQVLESDSLLDEYFESLNAAFDSVGPAPSAATLVDTAPQVVDAPRRRGDSLDDYFDRLSNAFEQAKPADAPHALSDSFDEFIEERHVPTVDALVGAPKPLENLQGSGNGNGHGSANGLNGHARNPIVDALEAMLGVPEPMLSQPTLPGLPEPEGHASGNGAPLNGANGNLADAVTERVLDRLLPEITATVQRLVREEVDRLRHS
ncbi:MAG TPA: response regulator [Vicinamibacterales bacterium]|nr:response regulator [Vicinamibacterales bacterium]